MKKKCILFVMMMLLHSAPLQAMMNDDILSNSSSTKSYSPEIVEIKAKLEEVKQRIRDNPIDPDAKKVIIIGPTRSGKDCLLNYLAGKKFVVTIAEGTRARVIEVAPPDVPLPGTHIGHGMSQTTVPSSWERQEDSTKYWNCPGFGDLRGPVQDIVNAFAIHKLLSGPTKIVLAVPESYGEDAGARFVTLLRQLTEMFPGDQLLQGLSLVITKYRGDDIDIFNLLHWLSTNPTQQDHYHLNNRAKELLKHVNENKEKIIANFPFPSVKEGLYPQEPKEEILKSIFSTSYIDNPEVVPQLQDNSLSFLDELARSLNNDINQHLETTVNQKILEYCTNTIKTSTKCISSLRKDLGGIKKHLKNLQLISSAEDFAKELDVYFGKEGSNIIKEIIHDLNFIKTIKKDIAFHVASWHEALTPTIKEIRSLTESPTHKITSNGMLSIKSSLLGTSDINSILRKKKEEDKEKEEQDIIYLHFINAYGLHAFFVDEDIKVGGIYFNIFSPLWNIIGHKTIYVRGEDGLPHEAGEKPSTNGAPGCPGKNGGHFYGKGQSFPNIGNLTIDISGGRGGPGQDGVAGCNGIDGENGDQTSVMDRSAKVVRKCSYVLGGGDGKFKQATLERNIPDKQIYNISINGTQFTYESKGKLGMAAQNGGKGGKGGKGGYHGFCCFEGLEGEPYHLVNDDGQNGDNGKAGGDGNGGKNGITYSADYIIKPVFTYYHYYTPKEYLAWGIPTVGIGALVLSALQHTPRTSRWDTCLRVDIEETDEAAIREERIPLEQNRDKKPNHDLNNLEPQSPSPQKTEKELKSKWAVFSTFAEKVTLDSKDEFPEGVFDDSPSDDIHSDEDDHGDGDIHSDDDTQGGGDAHGDDDTQSDEINTDSEKFSGIHSEVIPDSAEKREASLTETEMKLIGDIMVELYDNNINNIRSPDNVFKDVRENPGTRDISDEKLILIINNIIGHRQSGSIF